MVEGWILGSFWGGDVFMDGGRDGVWWRSGISFFVFKGRVLSGSA